MKVKAYKTIKGQKPMQESFPTLMDEKLIFGRLIKIVLVKKSRHKK